jgi:hypothetical protein
MIGSYVKFLNKVGKITNEYLGEVTVVMLSDGRSLNLLLSDLVPTPFHSIEALSTYRANEETNCRYSSKKKTI